MSWLPAFSMAVLILSAGCSPDTAGPPKGGGSERPKEVRLGPVLRLKGTGPLSLPLAFSNGSDEPFTYVTLGGEIIGMEYALYREGKLVPGDLPKGGPIPNPVYSAKELKPNESLTFGYKLNRHSKLNAGEYYLQIIYGKYRSAIDDKYKTTPAHFTLTYTLVVE